MWCHNVVREDIFGCVVMGWVFCFQESPFVDAVFSDCIVCNILL